MGGFDAVVGNPPYGSVLDTLGKLFVNANYNAVKTILDLFALFMEKASQIVKSGSEVGFIVPSGWLTSLQHKPLRVYLLKRFAFQLIVHLPYDVFPDAYIDTIVYIGKKQFNISDHYIITNVKTKRFGIRENAEQAFVYGLDYQVVDTSIWAQDISRRMLTETAGSRTLIQQKIKGPFYRRFQDFRCR